jgi:hypothetical protein
MQEMKIRVSCPSTYGAATSGTRLAWRTEDRMIRIMFEGRMIRIVSEGAGARHLFLHPSGGYSRVNRAGT